MNNTLEVKNLCKKYPAFELKSISFDVPKGYISGFIGPNGAGKTTTLKSILGIINVEDSAVNLCGNNICDIGVVMDTPFYPDEWTVAETGAALAPFYIGWNVSEYNKYVEKFNLDKKKKVKDLSRGMKVKLQLAAALSHNAKLLILDEPTSGLDPVAREEVCDILQEFISDGEKSVLFSTHITADLEKIADFIVFIVNGEIIYSGTKDRFVEKYRRIAGQTIDENLTPHTIGRRKHGTGFEAMINSADMAKFSGFSIEPVSIDEIIIFINRESGVANNE
ncbi:MAG: ABC transporter ATP-binding protein [Oscillospiraceae bacterium]|nr:ABC transporter ATP-binding protein [Oscillospiraceae bacterium]